MRTINEWWMNCPAKINLYLGVSGKRADGYHRLHSLAFKVELADRLECSLIEDEGPDELSIEGNTDLPITDNLVLRAVQEFRKVHPHCHGRLKFRLQKRIPVGAGLGGGSSNAVGALRCCEYFWGSTDKDRLRSVAAQLGSDCPFFLEPTPFWMRGRGEELEPLDPSQWTKFRGRRVLIAKPSFEISTVEAYDRLARMNRYRSETELEKEMSLVLAEPWGLHFNSFEDALANWLPTYGVVLSTLRARVKGLIGISGSGSACFAIPDNPETDFSAMEEILTAAWGKSHFSHQTSLK